jgi:excisionase family DNA binding protein
MYDNKSRKEVIYMERYYTVKEISSILNLAEITIRQWMGNGKLNFVRIGGKSVRIPESELNRILNK